ncbi:MAG TPA: response regulator transcription factor [Acidimicrobiales bacterium]|jgi:DNA-binding NarL/FixJ family response regulator|nr:response regulator transcription factor [Acidimicrobiales bacterium]
MTTVGIVEDHPLYRQGLIETVEASQDLHLSKVATTVGEMEQFPETVDVLLLDLHLPDAAGKEAVSRMLPKAGAILIVSASADRESVVEAISAGAKGYLTKAAESDEIRRAIEVVSRGDSYVSPQLAAFLLRDAAQVQPTSEFALTAREQEILSLLAEGDTDADIAQRLYISIRTVRSHLDRIRDKTGRRRRAELTRLAMENKPPR